MRVKWSAELVIHKIQERKAKGLSLRTTDIEKEDSNLYSASRRYFGGWREALTEAGVSTDTVFTKQVKWTKEKIIEAIQEYDKRGLGFTYKEVKEAGESKLYSATTRILGSWNDTLREAGVAEHKIPRTNTHWTRAKILKGIQEIHVKGESLNSTDVKNGSGGGLYTAATRFFGGWRKALEEAGLSEAEIGKHYMTRTKTDVISEVQELHKRGIDVRAGHMYTSEHRQLYRAGLKLFGGRWRNVIEAAGINLD